MYKVVIVRGANGVVGWYQRPVDPQVNDWVCSTDGFAVIGATDGPQAIDVAKSILVHSATITGVPTVVLELDL
jgi:hypothetical protein